MSAHLGRGYVLNCIAVQELGCVNNFGSLCLGRLSLCRLRPGGLSLGRLSLYSLSIVWLRFLGFVCVFFMTHIGCKCMLAALIKTPESIYISYQNVVNQSINRTLRLQMTSCTGDQGTSLSFRTILATSYGYYATSVIVVSHPTLLNKLLRYI